MDDDMNKLGEELVTTASRIVRWVPKDGIGISLAAARILARLLDNGPSRISDLAVQERSSQPTITNHVKRLEAAGLVRRESDPNDARAWMIGLTPAGHDELDHLRVTLGSNIKPYLDTLSRRELKALREGLEVMHRIMEPGRLRG